MRKANWARTFFGALCVALAAVAPVRGAEPETGAMAAVDVQAPTISTPPGAKVGAVTFAVSKSRPAIKAAIFSPARTSAARCGAKGLGATPRLAVTTGLAATAF